MSVLPNWTGIRLTAAVEMNPPGGQVVHFFHSVLSLFAAQDDTAALCYMLNKTGETVD